MSDEVCPEPEGNLPRVKVFGEDKESAPTGVIGSREIDELRHNGSKLSATGKNVNESNHGSVGVTIPHRVQEVRELLAEARERLQQYVASLPPEVQGLAEDLIVVERAVLDLGVAVGELREEVEDLRKELTDLYYTVTGEPKGW